MAGGISWDKHNRNYSLKKKRAKPFTYDPDSRSKGTGAIARASLFEMKKGGYNPHSVRSNQLRRGGKRADAVLRKFD